MELLPVFMILLSETSAGGRNKLVPLLQEHIHVDVSQGFYLHEKLGRMIPNVLKKIREMFNNDRNVDNQTRS